MTFLSRLTIRIGVAEAGSALGAALVAYWLKTPAAVIVLVAAVAALATLGARLHRRGARASRELRSLHAELSAMRETQHESADRQAALKAEVADLVQALILTEQAFRADYQMMATQVGEQFSAIPVIATRSASLDTKLDRLRAQADRACADIKGLAMELQAARDEQAALDGRTARSESRLDEMTDHAALFEAHVSERFDRAAQRHKAVEESLGGLTREVGGLRAQVADIIDNRVEVLDAAVQAVQAGVAKQSGRTASLEDKLAAQEAATRAVQAGLATNAGKAASLEDKLAAQEAATRAVQAGVATNAGKAASLEGKTNALEGKTTSLEDKLAALEAATHAVQAVADAQKAKAITLEGKVAALDSATSELSKSATAVRSGVMSIVRGDRLPHRFYGIDVFDPELDMLPLLARNIVPRSAIDVGANRGDYTAALRRSGFSVDAFEPLPLLAAELSARFDGDSDVRIHAVACSDEVGTAKLHTVMMDDDQNDQTLFSSLDQHPVFPGFEFSGKVSVPTTTLDTALAADGVLKPGILKIDTEGHDLVVLRGATRIDPCVLVVEFWDAEHVFNAGKVRNTLRDCLAAIDRERYPYYIVMWRQSGFTQFGVTVGGTETPPGSWGNVLFSADLELMKKLVGWAAETYGNDHLHVITRLP